MEKIYFISLHYNQAVQIEKNSKSASYCFAKIPQHIAL